MILFAAVPIGFALRWQCMRTRVAKHYRYKRRKP